MRNWDTLLNQGRFRSTSKDADDKRTEFERDYDRIVYSSAFRRLQDKAQVFPLEQSDFVRTRLTHSLETATLARSLGIDVARTLTDQKGYHTNYDNEFGNILASVALVHDIGNPPFGHFGEESISKWFRNYFEEKHNRSILKKEEQKDFTAFEGNAQTLRILSKLQVLTDNNGLNLTFATLASLLKYPRSSSEMKKKKGVSYNKFGYFISEKEKFERIKLETQLGQSRHPLAFLLEAADDIAYSAGDVEDGVKKGVITWQQLVDTIESDTSLATKDKEIAGFAKERYLKLKAEGFPQPEQLAMQLLRIGLQSRMLRACVEVFVGNVEQILDGSFDEPLLQVSDANALLQFLKVKIGVDYIYSNEQIIKQEIVGNKVIDSLLSLFVEAVRSNDYLDKRTFDGKVFSMISPSFVYVYNKSSKDMYSKLQLVTDYVSGMTDSFALDMYKKVNGISPI